MITGILTSPTAPSSHRTPSPFSPHQVSRSSLQLFLIKTTRTIITTMQQKPWQLYATHLKIFVRVEIHIFIHWFITNNPMRAPPRSSSPTRAWRQEIPSSTSATAPVTNFCITNICPVWDVYFSFHHDNISGTFPTTTTTSPEQPWSATETSPLRRCGKEYELVELTMEQAVCVGVCVCVCVCECGCGWLGGGTDRDMSVENPPYHGTDPYMLRNGSWHVGSGAYTSRNGH